jgi:hypothetical protein
MARHISGITFFRYPQYRNIGEPNNLKVLESNKPRSLTKIDKISQGHLTLKTEKVKYFIMIIIIM